MKLKFNSKFDTIGQIVYEPVSELPSLTDESFKDECDIDFIISNFVQRGIQPPEHQIEYGRQFTSDDFVKALGTVTECKSAFECLSSSEKERFNNSVTNFLDFISDPTNLKESYEKGYINPDTVDLQDVYPDRFVKEKFTSGNETADLQNFTNSSNKTDVNVAGTATASNPAQTNNITGPAE